MIGNDYSMTGSTGKEGRAGKIGFLVFGIAVIPVSLFG
jgi:hypothetical protein